ncbi:MAG: hypothetical protein HQL97_00415 [Magnetococcales bacterium]|nr:hypothetical protein [Magnetococcales bacterium]
MIRLLSVALTLMLLSSQAWAAGSRTFNGSTDQARAGATANAGLDALYTMAIVAKATSITTGALQVPLSRITSAGSNGAELRIVNTSGNLQVESNGSDTFTGSSTTAIAAGTWYLIAFRANGTDCSAAIHLLRYTMSTGATATEDGTFCWNETPSGTHDLVIGGRQAGFLQYPFGGSLAKALIVAGTATTDADLIAWACNGTIPTGTDAAYVLNGTASPEPDTSGNGYDATLTGTGEGSAPDACPNLRGLMLMGVGR